jgi:hypothetical protein
VAVRGGEGRSLHVLFPVARPDTGYWAARWLRYTTIRVTTALPAVQWCWCAMLWGEVVLMTAVAVDADVGVARCEGDRRAAMQPKLTTSGASRCVQSAAITCARPRSAEEDLRGNGLIQR